MIPNGCLMLLVSICCWEIHFFVLWIWGVYTLFWDDLGVGQGWVLLKLRGLVLKRNKVWPHSWVAHRVSRVLLRVSNVHSYPTWITTWDVRCRRPADICVMEIATKQETPNEETLGDRGYWLVAIRVWDVQKHAKTIFSWFGLVLWIREGNPLPIVSFPTSPWKCNPWAKCSSQWHVMIFPAPKLAAKALARTAGFPGIPGGTPPVVVAGVKNL